MSTCVWVHVYFACHVETHSLSAHSTFSDRWPPLWLKLVSTMDLGYGALGHLVADFWFDPGWVRNYWKRWYTNHVFCGIYIYTCNHIYIYILRLYIYIKIPVRRVGSFREIFWIWAHVWRNRGKKECWLIACNDEHTQYILNVCFADLKSKLWDQTWAQVQPLCMERSPFL